MSPEQESHVDDRPRCGGGIKTRQIANSALGIAAENRKSIEALQNRLPVWATIMLMLMSAIIGGGVGNLL